VDVVEYGRRRLIVVGAVMLATILQLADTTIVNVSIPTLDGNLGASIDEGTWFITSYIVANVIVIPLTPWLQGQFGRRRFFVVAIAGFTVMSIACGLATDTTTEIAFRFLQGAFGGGLMVPAQQIIRDTFPPRQLGMSQSLFGLAAVIGPTIGPTIGGYLTDALSWRWIFFINVVPGIVAAILVALYVRDPERPKAVSVDTIGIALLALGLGALEFALEEGEQRDWFSDVSIEVATVMALAGLVAFVLWELWSERPAVALRVLGHRAVWASSLVSFAVGFGLYGVFIISPEFSQGSLGFTTTLGGILLMQRAATMLVLFPLTTFIVSRRNLDLRAAIAVGLILYGAACWLQADVMTTTSSLQALTFTQILGGGGLALIFVPLNVALLRAIEPAIVPAALAISRLAQQIGGSIASATLITFSDRAFAFHQSILRDAIVLTRPAVALLTQTHSTTPMLLASIVAKQAQVLAYADASRLIGIVVLIAAPLPFLLRAQPAKPPPV
jgi:DHA2 family multidrug resistance protein